MFRKGFSHLFSISLLVLFCFQARPSEIFAKELTQHFLNFFLLLSWTKLRSIGDAFNELKPWKTRIIAFEQKKNKPALTFNSNKVSADRPSNNWAQNYNCTWLFFFFDIRRSSIPRKKKKRKDHTKTRGRWALTLMNTPSVNSPPPPPHPTTHPTTHTHPPRLPQVQIAEEPPKISPGVKSSTELPTVLLH